jgi:amino acid transporter
MAADTALHPMLTQLGVIFNNPGLISLGEFFSLSVGPNGPALLNTLFIVSATLVLIAGFKWFVRLLWVCFPITVVALAVLLYLMGTSSTSAFISSYNGYMSALNPSIPDFYHHVLDTAQAAGVNTAYSFEWRDTLGLSALAGVSALLWAFSTTGNAGELKQANVLSRQMIMVPGAVVFSAIGMALIGYVYQHTGGYDFIIAAANSQYQGLLAFPITPYITSFATILTRNPILVIIVALGTFLTAYQIIYQMFVIGTRMLLAQSFDRVLPEWISRVNKRTHTPVNAHLLFMVLGLIATYIYFYIPGMWLYTVSVWVPTTISMGLTMVAGILLPWRSKDIFKVSPVSKYKLGGVPVIVITGLIGLGYILWCLYNMFTVPAIGVLAPLPLAAIVGSYLILILGYVLVRYYRGKRGIDIALAFREIPPE